MKIGWILDIGVLKPCRRKGIGTLLMLKSMQSLKTLRMEEVSLYVDEMNPTKAIRLYEKLGFEIATKIILYQMRLA
jgi:ribosomal protein S18 acetylase RimI-like enzyme